MKNRISIGATLHSVEIKFTSVEEERKEIRRFLVEGSAGHSFRLTDSGYFYSPTSPPIAPSFRNFVDHFLSRVTTNLDLLSSLERLTKHVYWNSYSRADLFVYLATVDPARLA